MDTYKPLKGVKVVELGNMVAVASGCRMLSDLGADVIKVENMRVGDKMRAWAPQMALPGKDDSFAPVFDALNAGKRSLSIDSSSPEGAEALNRLLGTADIFFTNVREGALKKSGLDWETLHAKFPKLIMAQLHSYGEKGEEAGRPGYDNTSFWARGGFLYSQAIKGGNPVYMPMGMGDISCGMGLAASTLMALYAVRNGADGDCVSTSLYGMALWMANIPVSGSQFKEGTIRFPMTREGGSPYGVPYKCKDDKWFLPQIVNVDRDGAKFYATIGAADLNDDPRYASRLNVMKSGLGPVLMRRCAECFVQKTSQEWFDLFQQNDLPGERLSAYEDILHDEQARANGFVFDYEYPNGQVATLVRTVAATDASGQAEFAPGPKLGEHTAAILGELGYDEDQVQAMIAGGIAKQHD